MFTSDKIFKEFNAFCGTNVSSFCVIKSSNDVFLDENSLMIAEESVFKVEINPEVT